MNWLISVVRLGYGHVHPEGVAVLHDARFVCHHGHSVEGGLSVEEYEVAIEHMTVYDVAVFEYDGVEIDVAE